MINFIRRLFKQDRTFSSEKLTRKVFCTCGDILKYKKSDLKKCNKLHLEVEYKGCLDDTITSTYLDPFVPFICERCGKEYRLSNVYSLTEVKGES